MSTMPAQKKARTSESFDDSTFSDLTLRFGGETRRVHKIILCRKSGWFATALTSSFVVSLSRSVLAIVYTLTWLNEANSHEITLHDDDPEILNAMLDFCYVDCPLNILAKYKGATPAAFCARVYEIADKYDVPSLMDEIEAGFSTDSLQLTTREDQYLALAIVYRMPDAAAERLRNIMLKSVRSELNKMNTEKEFQDLITAQPQLAVDALHLLGKDVSAVSYTEYECLQPHCTDRFLVAPLVGETAGEKSKLSRYCPVCATTCQPRA